MSRIVGGQYLLQQKERTAFRNLLYKLAAFLQIRLLTYTCLSNHFHLLPRVPAKVKLCDRKLRNALRKFYGAKHPKTLEFIEALKNPKGTKLAQLREQYLKRMGDLSIFMKELKERFSKWFNDVHDRFGTFWAERFKSVAFPADYSQTLRTVAAYIDLNSVRAGLVPDPGQYACCGYTEALARAGPAREGLASFLPGRNWEEKLAGYRMVLFGKGAQAQKLGQASLDPAKAMEVLKKEGKLSLSEALLLKVRYFSEGIALGPEEFVNEVFEQCRKKYCKVRSQGSWPMLGADWGGMRSMKKIKEPFDLPAKLKE